MNTVSSMEGINSIVQTQETATAQKKSKVEGKTIGNPKLSEKAASYYEELKKKYSNMDFILVSKEKKEEAEANAASYATGNRMVVLIDDEKVEKMAKDQSYRAKYEGIISNAASGISQLAAGLANSPANVKTFGIKINDNGTASYFAVLDKGRALEKKLMEKKAEKNKAEKKAAQKKAEKKQQQERLDKAKADHVSVGKDETVTITASSIDELLRKVNQQVYDTMSDQAQTEEEKKVGQHMDYSL